MTNHVGQLYLATYTSNTTRINSVTAIGASTPTTVDGTAGVYAIKIAYPIYTAGTGTPGNW